MTTEEVFSHVKTLMYIGAGICGLIGITRIYQKWAGGQRQIDADIVTWLAGAMLMLIGAIAADAMF